MGGAAGLHVWCSCAGNIDRWEKVVRLDLLV